MCRFIAYIGNPLTIDELLYKPSNSLVKQSVHAHETDVSLNGDGFGIGWYNYETDRIPGQFRSIQPAWNDNNLKSLAQKIRSNCFLAHVRAASQGDVSQDNCHPFKYQQYLFMHNGDIGDFKKIKRHLRHELSDDIYDWIRGQTDSEHFFALFLETMRKHNLHFSAENAASILQETIKITEELKQQYQIVENSYINAVITDGKTMLAVRYVSNPASKHPETLYYAAGHHYAYEDNTCHIKPLKNNESVGAVLIVSERLTSYKAEWHEIPVNHMLMVLDDLSISLREIA